MATPVFTGTVDKGKLILDQPQKYLVQIAALNGKRVELVLRKKRNPRTLRQNAYYHGVVLEILSEHFGYDHDEMHDALKYQFLRFRSDKSPDLISVKSTTKLSTEEFNDYVNRIVRFAADKYGIFIPDPHQVEYGG